MVQSELEAAASAAEEADAAWVAEREGLVLQTRDLMEEVEGLGAGLTAAVAKLEASDAAAAEAALSEQHTRVASLTAELSTAPARLAAAEQHPARPISQGGRSRLEFYDVEAAMMVSDDSARYDGAPSRQLPSNWWPIGPLSPMRSARSLLERGVVFAGE